MATEVNDLLVFGEDNDILWSYDYKLKHGKALNPNSHLDSKQQDLTMSTGKKSKKISALSMKNNSKS